MSKSAIRAVAVAAVALAAITFDTALAQTGAGAPGYPNRPIRIIVPNAPGSATDGVTRLVAQRLVETMGQQTVIDNRAGAGGVIGHEIAMKAAPDGHTLLVTTSAGFILNPILGKVPYDSEKDFAPISLLVVSPQMLVSNPTVPARNVEELVALARAKPGQLNCASPGFGTSNHLGCEMIKTMTGVNFIHVPYKATAPAITDVVGGQVQFMFNSMPAVYPLAKAGKLRALGHGGTKRSPAAPEVPTIAESLPGFQCITWYAMVAPRGVPQPIIARLNGEIVKMMADPPFAQRIVDQGQEPQATPPADFLKYAKSEQVRWAEVIKKAGLKLER